MDAPGASSEAITQTATKATPAEFAIRGSRFVQNFFVILCELDDKYSQSDLLKHFD